MGNENPNRQPREDKRQLQAMLREAAENTAKLPKEGVSNGPVETKAVSPEARLKSAIKHLKSARKILKGIDSDNLPPHLLDRYERLLDDLDKLVADKTGEPK
jgi:hypothetical protein